MPRDAYPSQARDELFGMLREADLAVLEAKYGLPAPKAGGEWTREENHVHHFSYLHQLDAWKLAEPVLENLIRRNLPGDRERYTRIMHLVLEAWADQELDLLRRFAQQAIEVGP